MSSEQAVNADTIEQTKQQIRGLVSEIAQLSKSELGPEEFYPAFLQRIVSALAAIGGAVWVIRDGRRLDLAYHIKMSETLLSPESEDAARHFGLLTRIAASGEPSLVPPQSGTADEHGAANPTRYLLVLAPMRSDNQVEGVVEIFQRPDAQPVTQRGYLKFLMQMCELAAEWLKTRKLRQISTRHSLWEQADHFARLVHEQLDVRETAYVIVNEGRRMVGCDRVSVGLMRGRICKIEAISGQDTIENRSNIVNYLGKLATRVVATGESLWYDGADEELPPQVEEALDRYIDESHTKRLALLPLRRPKRLVDARETATGEADSESNEANEIIGVLVVEQIESDLPEEVLRSRTDLVYEHSARALTNAVDHERIFLMPLWKAIGKSRWLFGPRYLPKTVAVLAALVVFMLCLVFVRKDFEPSAKGTLQPVVKRDVFVPVDGDVIDVKVQDRDFVEKGDLLVKLRNTDLEVKYQDVLGQIQVKRSRLVSVRRSLFEQTGRSDVRGRDEVERIRLSGEADELEQELKTLDEQYQLLAKKREMLEIRSPIAGEVMMSWDVQKSLMYRPVTMGQMLLSVADPKEDWELELYMRESRAGHVRRARADTQTQQRYPGAGDRVSYVLATDPGVKRGGTVREVKATTEVRQDEGNIVKVRVDIDRSQIGDPHPGATVTGQVFCGRRALGYVWFHEAWEWLQIHIFFYLS
jgi:multidrug efflux pump subunit AcrA (membrane-fusion protein)